jgi:hypothetical protein
MRIPGSAADGGNLFRGVEEKSHGEETIYKHKKLNVLDVIW